MTEPGAQSEEANWERLQLSGALECGSPLPRVRVTSDRAQSWADGGADREEVASDRADNEEWKAVIRVSCGGAEGQSGEQSRGAMDRKSFRRKREWKAMLYKTSMLVETSIFCWPPDSQTIETFE